MAAGASSTKRQGNRHDTREGWLAAATHDLRPYFSKCGYEIPDKMRFSIGFASNGRQGRRRGELWHGVTSEDGTFELFIRADVDDPAEVLGILVHELVHACLPIDAGHGPKYRDAAQKVGLVGPARDAMPGLMLSQKLAALAADLGPLPHARLNIERGRDNRGPADRAKKQKARLLKAECTAEGCGFSVRVTSKWLDQVGAPHCPAHGEMSISKKPAPDDDDETDAETGAPAESAAASEAARV